MTTPNNNRSVANHMAWRLSDSLRGILDDPFDPSSLYALTYCIYIDRLFKGECNTPSDVVSRYIKDDEIKLFIENTLLRRASPEINSVYPLLKYEYPVEFLDAFLVEPEIDWPRTGMAHSTPATICDLALSLLDPKPGSKIIDFGSGIGNFMMRANETYPSSSVSGIEINADAAALARIRMSIPKLRNLAELSAEDDSAKARAISESLIADIQVGDMFQLFEAGMCDYAFSNYPCGLRTASLRPDSEFIQRAVSGKLGYSRPTSADWVFNHMLVDAIADGGRAIAIISGGACYNTTDEGARRFFVENGLIESVIALPPRIFPGIGIGFTLLVLSKGCDMIRMVDASDLFETGRRTNSLRSDAIETIEERLKADIEGFSRTVNRKELAGSGYALSPAMFLKRPVEIKDALRLGDVVLEIRRGATLRANELDNLAKNEATNCRYLMLRDIQDGSISDDLPFLGELDKKLEKHCIKNGDVLISKNGAPFKVAVAEVPEGATILANGNLYMLTVDEDAIDPYYLAAFLSSNKGMEVLSRAVVGVTIPSIPLKNLREVPIPVPPIEKQEAISADYQAKLDELRVLKLRVQRAVDDMRTMFDGEE